MAKKSSELDFVQSGKVRVIAEEPDSAENKLNLTHRNHFLRPRKLDRILFFPNHRNGLGLIGSMEAPFPEDMGSKPHIESLVNVFWKQGAVLKVFK